MVYMAAVTGKALTDEQKLGSGIAITGVLLYSLIDDLLKPKKKVDWKRSCYFLWIPFIIVIVARPPTGTNNVCYTS